MTTTTPDPAVVADVMHAEPIVVRADAPLSEAADLMERHQVSGLPVVDHAGVLLGVVSRTDLVRVFATQHLWENWPGLSVRHLMSSPALTVHCSTPLLTAARMMERHRVHRLVVVADDEPTRPIGVISTSDLAQVVAGGRP
jgi:CBS domain-containing protein